MVVNFVQKREASHDPLLFDLRTSERLSVIERVARAGADPQAIINRLVDLYDAITTVPGPT